MLWTATDHWRAAFPGAQAGLLAMADVDNPPEHAGLDARKAALEAELAARWAGSDRRALSAHGPLPAYAAYYKSFNKTYHVLGQLESVALKGKPLPRVAALVEAMFMAELSHLLLTAGHDLDTLELPVQVDVATGNEAYTTLRGQPQQLKAGDMFMADQQGVISSIVYGPDQRTAIRPSTRNVLFAVYAPPGIGPLAVQAHLEHIRDLLHIITPTAAVRDLAVLSALT